MRVRTYTAVVGAILGDFAKYGVLQRRALGFDVGEGERGR